jgi:hypothetical protein
MVMPDDVEESDDVVMGGVLSFAEVAECGYFAIEEVACDFVVDFSEVDDFDGDLMVGLSALKAQIDVAGGPLSEEM